MKRVLKFALATVVVVGLSGLAINKILEEKTTDCAVEVAELAKASGTLGVFLVAPNQEIVNALAFADAITSATNVVIGSPYLAVAALDSNAATIYVKVLLEEGKIYSPEVEEEIKQIQSSMHKDSMRCSMQGKKYEVYRAKSMLNLNQKTSSPI